jgi:hypothetical protein
MSIQCKDSKKSENQLSVVLPKEKPYAPSYSTLPAPESLRMQGTLKGTVSPPTKIPCSTGFSHFTNSSPKSDLTLGEKSTKFVQPVQPSMRLGNTAELSFSEMKAFVFSEINFSDFESLGKIFEEVSKRCQGFDEFVQRREALGLVLKIFELINTRRHNIRKIVSPQEYEIFFRTVFAWNDPVFVFELACIEFEYSKKTDKNFAILIRHLTNNLHRVDPHTYLRLFIRLTYFVNVHFKTLQKSFKSLKVSAQRNGSTRKMILSHLESLNEFKELIKINKIELFREKQSHVMNHKIPDLIHKAMRLTGDFPYSDFDIINRNLARIFFLHCHDAKSLSSEKYWNCVTFSINMFPKVPIALCSNVLKTIIQKVTLFKALGQVFATQSRTRNSNSNNMSLILKIFRFQLDPKKPLNIHTDTITKIEKFSCYNQDDFTRIHEEQQKLINNYIDPMLYIFKQLITICLNGFYFLQMIIHTHSDFEQLPLLKSTEDIYKQFLKLAVALGIQMARHSKRISMSSREILSVIEGKLKVSSIEKQKLMKTVIKVKRAYESMFSFMNAKRKLYSFVRLAQKNVDQEMFDLMSLFIY